MKKRISSTIFMLVISFFLVGIGYEFAGGAEKPEDFYRGSTIKLISAAGAGTGIGLVARTTVPYLEKYTGARTVIVEYKTKGSGLEGVNAVRIAKSDGLTLGMWQVLSQTMNQLMNAQGWGDIKVEEEEFIMSFPLEPHLFSVTPGGPYQNISQLKAARNLRIAGHGPASNMTMVGCTIADILDLDAKVIIGIAGVANVAKSVMQGETNGTAIPLSTALRFVQQGQLKPLFVVASERNKSAPDIPALSELLKDMTPRKKTLLDLWGERLPLSTVIWTTPGTPKDRVDYLREVSRKIVADKEFQKEMKKFYLYELNEGDFPTGEGMEKRIKGVMRDKKEIRNELAGLLKKYR